MGASFSFFIIIGKSIKVCLINSPLSAPSNFTYFTLFQESYAEGIASHSLRLFTCKFHQAFL